MSLVTEGLAKIEVGKAFFNPKMESCRDLSVLVLRQLGPVSVCDGFAATGARGIRYKLECPNVKKITFAEVNEDVAKVCKKNLRLNRIKAGVAKKDIRTFLRNEKTGFDVIDLDPFGTPAIYVYDAISSLARNPESYLFATATDTAVLCGAHRRACQKTYNAVSLNASFCHELGIRILLGFIARVAAQFNLGMVPLLSYSHGHFMRVHVKLLRGDVHAQPSIAQVGHTCYCHGCRETRSFLPHDRVVLEAGSCSAKAAKSNAPNTIASVKGCRWTLLGPVWLGPLHDNQLLLELLAQGTKYGGLFRTMLDENQFLYYHDMHETAGRVGRQPRKIDEFIAEVRKSGYDACRTHFSPLGLKTSMPLKELEELF